MNRNRNKTGAVMVLLAMVALFVVGRARIWDTITPINSIGYFSDVDRFPENYQRRSGVVLWDALSSLPHEIQMSEESGSASLLLGVHGRNLLKLVLVLAVGAALGWVFCWKRL
jgi:hypothetical protein